MESQAGAWDSGRAVIGYAMPLIEYLKYPIVINEKGFIVADSLFYWDKIEGIRTNRDFPLMLYRLPIDRIEILFQSGEIISINKRDISSLHVNTLHEQSLPLVIKEQAYFEFVKYVKEKAAKSRNFVFSPVERKIFFGVGVFSISGYLFDLLLGKHLKEYREPAYMIIILLGSLFGALAGWLWACHCVNKKELANPSCEDFSFTGNKE